MDDAGDTRVESGEETLRALFNAVTEAILMIDPEGTVLTLNETAARRFGKTVKEMTGARMEDMGDELLPRAAVEGRVRHIAEVVRTGQPVRFEDVRAGRRLDTSMYPVLDPAGVVRQIAVFSRDVTERTHIENKLRENEEKYRAVVESAGEAIAIIDEHGVFQFMNGTAARALGGAPCDFTGKTMWDLFPKDVADRQAAAVRQVIATTSRYASLAMSCVGGQWRWYGTTIEPLRDGQNKVTAGLLIARDVHELQTAQRELEASREKMTRAEQLASLGTLSATFAHELTQPLTVIRLSLQNAMKGFEGAGPSATVMDDLADALAEISHMTAIVERFRGFARKTSDKTLGPVDLSAAARRVLRLFDQEARKVGLSLATETVEDLPRIHANERDIEQVFFCLIQNAIQAARGLGDRHFRIVGVRGGDEVELHFADDCGGIAPEHLGHVFEPFFTTKPSGEGTGLGLCIVQRIVTHAGGRIRVDSRFGEGTTIVVTLPTGQQS
jgi:PAS domain S-box-containing protein